MRRYGFWRLRSGTSPAFLAGVEAKTMAPLMQAGRCLDIWLAEEGRALSPRHRQRAVALIARYFAHEEDVTDQLILSFLRHYSGFSAIDLDDPHAVRHELKAALDRAGMAPPRGTAHLRPWLAAATGVISTAAVLIVIFLSQQTLTPQQQQELRAAVAVKARAEGLTTAAVWAEIKRDLDVSRYQDIRRWDYDAALVRIKSK
jgi:hypothetical protein